DRRQQLRGGDDLGVVTLGPEAAGQSEAGRPGLVDDLGDPLAERAEPLEEDLGPGGLDPGGDQPAAVAEEGDAGGRLVDVDADVNRLARLEADRLGGLPDDGELRRLGGRRGLDLRSGTSVSPTQVCPPDSSPVFMLSTVWPSSVRRPFIAAVSGLFRNGIQLSRNWFAEKALPQDESWMFHVRIFLRTPLLAARLRPTWAVRVHDQRGQRRAGR